MVGIVNFSRPLVAAHEIDGELGHSSSRIGARAQTSAGEDFEMQARALGGNGFAHPQGNTSRSGNADGASALEDAKKQLSDPEVADAQTQISALKGTKGGRAIDTGNSARDTRITDNISKDPMNTLHQTNLDQAIAKMEQAIEARDPTALESAGKTALKSAKDLDGLRNDHEKTVMTQASLGTSQTGLGETLRQNKFSRGSMMVTGGVAVAGVAAAATIGSINASKTHHS